MAGVTRFEDLEAWKTARSLTRFVYDVTGKGSFAKDFGLRDQVRRAAVSVMSNIAEGFDSSTDAQFNRYLGHAKASSAETRCQFYVAYDLAYVSEAEFRSAQELTDKASRQVSRLVSYLEAHPRRVHEENAEYTASLDAERVTRNATDV